LHNLIAYCKLSTEFNFKLFQILEMDNTPEISRKARKTRNTIAKDMFKTAKNMLAKDVRVKDIAEVLELSLTCTYRFVAKIGDGKEEDEIFAAKKGRKKREYCNAKTSISGMLLRDSSLNQKDIGNNLKDMNMGRSQSGVSRMLKCMNYTRKRLVTIPEARNAPRNIDMRQEYSRMIGFVSDENLVYIDETGINLHMV